MHRGLQEGVDVCNSSLDKLQKLSYLKRALELDSKFLSSFLLVELKSCNYCIWEIFFVYTYDIMALTTSIRDLASSTFLQACQVLMIGTVGAGDFTPFFFP